MGEEEVEAGRTEQRIQGKPTLGRPVIGTGECVSFGPDTAMLQAVVPAPSQLCFVEVVVCVWCCYGKCTNVLILSYLV